VRVACHEVAVAVDDLERRLAFAAGPDPGVYPCRSGSWRACLARADSVAAFLKVTVAGSVHPPGIT